MILIHEEPFLFWRTFFLSGPFTLVNTSFGEPQPDWRIPYWHTPYWQACDYGKLFQWQTLYFDELYFILLDSF